MIAFGPVPSRRLGKSLGINNIPYKYCSYSCVYCQIGVTPGQSVERREFYQVTEIIEKVKEKIDEGHKIDYLTLVPDGEPTLDINLINEIRELKKFKIKIAVITNASLIWKKEVQETLSLADLVSLKIDAVSKPGWKKINCPCNDLVHEKILNGVIEFSNIFQGELVTETMMIHWMNDNYSEIIRIAEFISKLKVDKSYLAIPTRPPGNKWAMPPKMETVLTAFQIFSKFGLKVEYLIGFEGNEFANSGNIEKDILSITSVHPMREESVRELINRSNSDWSVIENMIRQNKLIETEYDSIKFYMRKF